MLYFYNYNYKNFFFYLSQKILIELTIIWKLVRLRKVSRIVCY